MTLNRNSHAHASMTPAVRCLCLKRPTVTASLLVLLGASVVTPAAQRSEDRLGLGDYLQEQYHEEPKGNEWTEWRWCSLGDTVQYRWRYKVCLTECAKDVQFRLSSKAVEKEAPVKYRIRIQRRAPGGYGGTDPIVVNGSVKVGHISATRFPGDYGAPPASLVVDQGLRILSVACDASLTEVSLGAWATTKFKYLRRHANAQTQGEVEQSFTKGSNDGELVLHYQNNSVYFRGYEEHRRASYALVIPLAGVTIGDVEAHPDELPQNYAVRISCRQGNCLKGTLDYVESPLTKNGRESYQTGSFYTRYQSHELAVAAKEQLNRLVLRAVAAR